MHYTQSPLPAATKTIFSAATLKSRYHSSAAYPCKEECLLHWYQVEVCKSMQSHLQQQLTAKLAKTFASPKYISGACTRGNVHLPSSPSRYKSSRRQILVTSVHEAALGTSLLVLLMATSLSIDAYKRKQNVLAAKAHKRRVSASSNQRNSMSEASYTPDQRRYLDACVEKNVDPDPRLLAALRESRFVLKLDRFGQEELVFNMGFLQKVKTCKHISLSLGSVAINRDLRAKFDRLGLKRAYAYENEGRSIATRAACTSMYNTPHLVRFHIIGVEISSDVLPLLAKALFHGQELEDVSLNGTNLGDKGLEAIAMALGRCPKLHSISLAGCSLTDKAKDPIAKIISLHGVIKDEAIWSSSLRGEVADPPLPDLLINLSKNNLGDEAAEAICDALYNDKWLLGLNLGGNYLSQQGVDLLISTLTKSNVTLAVLALANMINPVEPSTLATLDLILHPRDRYLQQMATESREKRMALGSLLLDWGVDKEKVVEICYLESSGKGGAKTIPKSLTLASPKHRVDRVYPRAIVSSNNVIRVSNQDSNDNNSVEDDDDNEMEDSAATSHVKTIEYLIERLSALEAERRKTQAYVEKVEAENQQLRAELEVRANAAPPAGISAIEAQIIAQLETSISSLAEQVEIMEHEKQQKPPSTHDYYM